MNNTKMLRPIKTCKNIHREKIMNNKIFIYILIIILYGYQVMTMFLILLPFLLQNIVLLTCKRSQSTNLVC
jgi:hypothetical protein